MAAGFWLGGSVGVYVNEVRKLLPETTKYIDVANLAQEKISGSMLAEAISAICEEEGVGCQLAQVYPNPEGMRYVICLEPDRAPADEKAFAEALDKGLCDKLIQYAAYRNKLLNPCGLVLMEEGWCTKLMKKYAKGNATVAQVKVPVVIDKLP